MKLLRISCLMLGLSFCAVQAMNIWQAVDSGSVQKVKELIDTDPSLLTARKVSNDPKTLRPPLLLAIENGDIDMVKCLVEKMKEKNIKKEDGINFDAGMASPLQFAAQQKDVPVNLEIIKYLIENGADVTAKDPISNATPMQLAWISAKWGIVDYLRKNGGGKIEGTLYRNNLPTITVLLLKTYPELMVDMMKLGAKCKYDYTVSEALSILISQGVALPIIKYLVEEKNADVNFKLLGGSLPLDSAIAVGNSAVVEYLIKKNAIVSDGHLDSALRGNNLDIVRFLVKKMKEKGISIDAPSSYWRLTPLHYALKDGKKDIAKFLVKSGASLDIKDSDNKTPLDYLTDETEKTAFKNLAEEVKLQNLADALYLLSR